MLEFLRASVYDDASGWNGLGKPARAAHFEKSQGLYHAYFIETLGIGQELGLQTEVLTLASHLMRGFSASRTWEGDAHSEAQQRVLRYLRTQQPNTRVPKG